MLTMLDCGSGLRIWIADLESACSLCLYEGLLSAVVRRSTHQQSANSKQHKQTAVTLIVTSASLPLEAAVAAAAAAPPFLAVPVGSSISWKMFT